MYAILPSNSPIYFKTKSKHHKILWKKGRIPNSKVWKKAYLNWFGGHILCRRLKIWPHFRRFSNNNSTFDHYKLCFRDKLSSYIALNSFAFHMKFFFSMPKVFLFTSALHISKLNGRSLTDRKNPSSYKWHIKFDEIDF